MIYVIQLTSYKIYFTAHKSQNATKYLASSPRVHPLSKQRTCFFFPWKKCSAVLEKCRRFGMDQRTLLEFSFGRKGFSPRFQGVCQAQPVVQ